MRLIRLVCAFLMLVVAMLLPLAAQENETTPATDAESTEFDPFPLTATEIIRQATARATVFVTIPPTVTATPLDAQSALETPEATEETTIPDAEPSTDDDALVLTFVAFGFLFVILGVFGYVVATTSSVRGG